MSLEAGYGRELLGNLLGRAVVECEEKFGVKAYFAPAPGVSIDPLGKVPAGGPWECVAIDGVAAVPLGEFGCSAPGAEVSRDALLAYLAEKAFATVITLRSLLSAQSTPLVEGQTIDALLGDSRYQATFQPLMDASTGRPIGHEALSSFAGYGIKPLDMLALADTRGLRGELEIALAHSAIKAFACSAPCQGFLSLNLSEEGICSGYLEGLLNGAVAPQQLVIEITETRPIGNYEQVLMHLERARARGVRVAVDDVGAGYASLHHVLELSPDIIKVDRSLVAKVGEKPQYAQMLRMLGLYAARIGALCIAEGVETAQQATILQLEGIRYQQGYYYQGPSAVLACAGAGTCQAA
ncbi:EAL domain-containing protein [Parahaliea aestuarii]|nr:EAL domain-containing protein [Parahaliea aestuarii]